MGVAQVETRVRERAPALGASAAVFALVLCGAAVLTLVGLVVQRPITFPDEIIYGDLARSFAESRHFEIAGTETSVWTYGPIYPLLLAPIFWIAPTVHDAYVAARAFNVLAFASA